MLLAKYWGNTTIGLLQFDSVIKKALVELVKLSAQIPIPPDEVHG
jgi:hypothetical protein